MTSAPPLDARAARQLLADEWLARDPQTPAEINAFYRTAEHLAPDLEAFHADPGRQQWTSVLVQTARQYLPATATKLYIDIGSGLGHDLRAVKAAVPAAQCLGVEPNLALRGGLLEAADGLYDDVAYAPLEDADLISCFDVLEHIPDPETWLGDIARRAKEHAVLLETCATFDFGTPLHLRANAGWHPGRVLEAHGWQQLGGTGRLRYWQKRAAKVKHTSLMLAAYRGVATDTFLAIVSLLTAPNAADYGWRLSTAGEAGVNRARSVLVSRWFRETADDVFIMIDDDIIFTPAHAQRLVAQCRAGYDIICGAYSVRDGAHMAIRGLESQPEVSVGPAAGDPVEIRWAATGFLAVHRRVIEALVPTLPLCHEATHFSFWPLFDFRVVEDAHTGGHNYLSEDWNFCEQARARGFKVWLDPTLILGHLGTVTIHAGNMGAIHQAVTVPR